MTAPFYAKSASRAVSFCVRRAGGRGAQKPSANIANATARPISGTTTVIAAIGK